MYVEDMPLVEARQWERELSARLRGTLGPPQREQLTWDLEDVRGRIGELS